MKILMISTDRGLFEADAPVRDRLLEQAGLAEELAVVVLTPKGEAFSEQRPSPSLSLHPTSSASRYSYLSDAYRIANAILAEEKSDEWLITTQDPFLVGALGYLLSRKHKVPLHLQLHTDPWSEAWRSERLRNRIEYLTCASFSRKPQACVWSRSGYDAR
jgi:hypothetical protein